MEPVEFLAGKYRDAELMVPGVIQTYRAREASTGKAVFVHRVSMKEQQQSALLAMLRSALLSSADVRKRIVEFGDDQGYWHVVTQADPDCLLLKPWLEAQTGQGPGSDATVVKPSEPAPKATQPAAAKAQELTPARETAKPAEPGPAAKTDSGEFARLFGSAPAKPASSVGVQAPDASPAGKEKPPAGAPPPKTGEAPGEFTRLFQTAPPKPAEQPSPAPAVTPSALRAEPVAPPQRVGDPLAVTERKDESTAASPGEFTRLFHPAVQPRDAAKSEVPKAQPATPPEPAANAPLRKEEPGEFTRLFSSESAVPARDTLNSNRDRPSRGFVQRPNTPMPPIRPTTPAAEKTSEPGEFTRLFSSPESKPASSPVPPPATPPAPQNQEPGEFTRLFSSAPQPAPARSSFAPRPATGGTPDPFAPDPFGAEAPALKPSPSEQAGEFTRLFGSTRPVPLEQQAPAKAAPASVPQPPPDEPLFKTRISSPAPPASVPPQKGPSEFTQIIGGNAAPESSAAPASAAPPAGTGAPGAGIDVSKAKELAGRIKTPPIPPKPHLPQAKLPTGVPAVALPETKNKKLLIFFVILGVLAIALVVLILLILKK